MIKKYKLVLTIMLFTIMMLPITSVCAKVSYINCGNVTKIPEKIPELTNWIMLVIEIAVPVVLVIMGSIDLFKGITAQKEDQIKKGQQIFVKRILVAVIIFFVIAIVKFIVSIVASTTEDKYGKSESKNISECIDCFLNGTDNCKIYK